MTEVAIKIPEDLGKFIEESVKTGAFLDASDFVLNLLQNVKALSESEHSEEQQTKLALLRGEIAVGIGEADREEFVEFTAADIITAGRAKRAAIAG